MGVGEGDEVGVAGCGMLLVVEVGMAGGGLDAEVSVAGSGRGGGHTTSL